MKLTKISDERKQTLIFLSLASHVKPITFTSKVRFKKELFKFITPLLIKSVSLAFEYYPDLNCMMKHGSLNKVLCLDRIHARLTIVKKENDIDGVYSFVIKDSNKKTVSELKNEILKIKETPLQNFSFYNRFKLLQKLPLLIGKIVTNLLLLKKENQEELWGSFTVTSLGKNSPNLCIPISGSTFTFTLGASRNLDHDLCECNLTMVFDHRILDGLQASQFLNKIKEYFIKLQDDWDYEN